MDGYNIYDLLLQYTRPLGTALWFRDFLTRTHSDRVSQLSLQIGRVMHLDAMNLSALKISTLLHDIGKIGIPDHILLKKDAFNASEWETMKLHSEYGEKIIISAGLEGSKRTSLAVRHHHEHFNGSGYPDGLAGDQIPICSRIMALADSYDAMAVTRPYHQARSHCEIMAIMQDEKGEKFDPELFDIFCDCIKSSSMKAD